MKCVVITGSAKGFGFELAKCFREKNYNVVLSDLSMAALNAAKEKLEQTPSTGKIECVVCNVTDYKMLENLYETSEKRFGAVDVWINNAGVNQRDVPMWELDQKEIDFLVDIDVKGTIYGSCIAFRKMQQKGMGGQIFNVEGYGSNDAMMLGLSMYGTSKRAITYFSEALAKEAKTTNSKICVGRISPGIMITDFITSANGNNGEIKLSEKTKKVYNILGDYPSTIANFIANKIDKNKKNNVKFNWLTNFKAFTRFLTAGFKKRNFFNN